MQAPHQQPCLARPAPPPSAKLPEPPPSAARPMQRGGGDCLRRYRRGKWVSAGGACWPQVSRRRPWPARPGGWRADLAGGQTDHLLFPGGGTRESGRGSRSSIAVARSASLWRGKQPPVPRRPSVAASQDVSGSFIGLLLCALVQRSAGSTAVECWARPRLTPLWVSGAR